MCTVSVVASRDGNALRVLMNRDERRLRPVARPPEQHHVQGVTAIWPVDPVSGGTWIAATDAGLTFALLNLDGQRASDRHLSRGLVIPRLAACRTLDDVATEWRTIDRTAFAPFRLLVLNRRTLMVYSSAEPTAALQAVGGAHLWASSSYGDGFVEPLRRALFDGILRGEADPWAAQTRLHAHAWPDRRHLSVMMTRVDASTVSQTEVIMTGGDVSLAYRPVVEGWPAGETRAAFRVRRPAARAA